MTVDLGSEGLDALAEFDGELGELRVLLEKFQEECGVACCDVEPFLAGFGQSLVVLGIGISVCFVAICLSGLRQ